METRSTQSSEPSVFPLRWATAAIRRFLATLVEGAIFATRDLLSLGSRSTIDSALSRMVVSGRIVRLASGLFLKVKTDDPDWRPSTEKIVQAKLLSFRRIGVAAADAQSVAEGETSAAAPEKCETVVYEITGNNSRFRLFNGIIVQVKSIANRKLDLAQCVVGKKLKKLWQSVGTICADSARAFARGLGREERTDVKVLLPLLPKKLSDLLGSPWNHSPEVFPVSSIRNDSSGVEWFSLDAINEKRTQRTIKRPPPLLELNF